MKAEIFKKDGNKETWHYVYDALGRRITKAQTAVSDRHAEDNACLKENRTEFLWDGSHLLQEQGSDGLYTYIYTDLDSYEPLAQIHNWMNKEGESQQQTNYFHCDQIGIPREMTDSDGNLLWFGDYHGWGKLKSETNITNAHQPFRLQNQYCDAETGLHYNFFRYYEPEVGRFVNQDPIGLEGGDNLYQFAPNIEGWVDPLGLHPAVIVAAGAVIVAASRTIAIRIAKQFAQVPRLSKTNAGGKPISEKIPLDDLNKSSRGKNWNELNKKGADLGRRSKCGKCEYMDHPDGHPDEDAAHHKPPHIHAKNKKGQKIIITYPGLKK